MKINRLRIKDEISEKSFSRKPIHLDIRATISQLSHFINTIESTARIYQVETFFLVTRSASTSNCYEPELKLYVFQDLIKST